MIKTSLILQSLVRPPGHQRFHRPYRTLMLVLIMITTVHHDDSSESDESKIN
jgi:hypothetical protein